MGSGGACGGYGDAGAADPLHDRELASGHVDDGRGNKERADMPRSLLHQPGVVHLDIAKAADSGADGKADALPVAVVYLDAAVINSLNACRNSVLNKQIHLPAVFH